MIDYLLPFILLIPQMTIKHNGNEITAREAIIATKLPAFKMTHIVLGYPIEFALNLLSPHTDYPNPKSLQVLLMIAYSRTKGIAQTQISLKGGFDAKDAFRFIKPLIAAKLVLKVPAVVQGKCTNLLIHCRYLAFAPAYQAHIESFNFDDLAPLQITTSHAHMTHDTSRINTNLVRKRILVILKAAKNHTLLATDLMNLLQININLKRIRKSFYKLVSALVDDKCVEYIMIPKIDNHNVGYHRCLRFISEYDYSVSEGLSDPLQLGNGLTVEKTLDAQIYGVICKAGYEGVTGLQIEKSLSNISKKLMETSMERLTNDNKKNGSYVTAVLQSDGRARVYKYYESKILSKKKPQYEDAVGSKEVTDFKEIVYSAAKSNSLAGSEALAIVNLKASVIVGADILQFPGLETTMAEILEPPIVNLEDIGKLPQFLNMETLNLGHELPQFLNLASESQPIQSAKKLPPNLSRDKDERLHEVVNTLAFSRRSAILHLLESPKILVLGTELVGRVQEFIESKNNEKLKHTIDKRTIERDCEKLVGGGKIVKHMVSLSRINGSRYTKSIIVHPSLPIKSAIVKEFLDSLQDSLLVALIPFKPKLIADIDIDILALSESTIDVVVESPTPHTEEDQTMAAIYEIKEIQQEYGYITGKCLRLRCLHEWIIKYVSSITPFMWGNVKYPKVLVKTAIFFKDLPVDMFLRVIGKNTKCEALDSFLEVAGNGDVPICDLSIEIKAMLMGSSRFKPAIWMYVEMLKNLGLIELDESEWETTRSCSQVSFSCKLSSICDTLCLFQISVLILQV